MGSYPYVMLVILVAMQVAAIKVGLKCMQMHKTARVHDKLQVDILFTIFGIIIIKLCILQF